MSTILDELIYLNTIESKLTEGHVSHSAILQNPNLPVKECEYFKYTFESEAQVASMYFKYVKSAAPLELDLEDDVLDQAFIDFARTVVASPASKNARNSLFGSRANSLNLETLFLLFIYFT